MATSSKKEIEKKKKKSEAPLSGCAFLSYRDIFTHQSERTHNEMRSHHAK